MTGTTNGSDGATMAQGEAMHQAAPETAEETAAGAPGEATGEKTRLFWDESDMRLSYANVVNVTAAPGEINVFFGANRTTAPGGHEVRVKLSDRIVMTQFTARRLMVMLAATLKDYEARQTAAAEAKAESTGTEARKS